jgi:hypothetical protein
VVASTQVSDFAGLKVGTLVGLNITQKKRIFSYAPMVRIFGLWLFSLRLSRCLWGGKHSHMAISGRTKALAQGAFTVGF